ncbi:hypothetical protein [Gilvimarinus sp. DA14]|uniref:DUF7931 domain-containing protein n=1 Tax=Gilvimarinus sp. DA14 TaxID=2956798 RepID=UPI0020B77F7B|nr:hypothetical protein [Gilvimarinus sp. DA14]UTF60309.1 hypothetical protein NHM04_00510 [Gilvimarinus sp. DA14]
MHSSDDLNQQHLQRLESLQEFIDHTHKIIGLGRRKLSILSHQLDPYIYHREDTSRLVSRFCRQSRDAQVRILVRDTSDLVDRGHLLAKLHQRLPSKVQLRKLTIEPTNVQMGFLIVDTQYLLYKNDDLQHSGFANYRAFAEIKNLMEDFDRAWEHGEPDPNLRILNI